MLQQPSATQSLSTDRKRLALIVSLLATLLGIAAFFFFFLLAELNQRKAFSEQQLLGTHYVGPLFSLQRDLVQHYHLATSAQSDSSKNRLTSFQRKIADAVTTIDAIDHEVGETLSTTLLWSEVRRDWQRVRNAALQQSSPQLTLAHAALMGDATTLLAHIGDRSNLILDPDLDGYYLAETLLTRLPTLLDRIEQIRTAKPVARSSAQAAQDRLKLRSHVEAIALAQKAIKHNLDVVFSSTDNKGLQPLMTSKLDALNARITLMMAALTNGSSDTASSDQYADMITATTEAILAGAQLYDTVLSALRETAQARIDAIAWKSLFVKLVAAITALIVVGLFASFYRNHQARQQAERVRQAKENQLRAIVQGALDAVVTMDRHGIVADWNPQAEVIFGYSRQEAVGQPLANLIIPSEYREAHAKGLQRFMSTGEEKILRKRIEITAVRKSGGVFPVELTVTPLHLGDQILFSSFIRDITVHKEAIDKLKTSEERFQLAIKGANDGIWDWNLVTNEIYFSPRFKELLGYDDQGFPNELSSFWSHLHPNDHQWVDTAVREHLTNKQPYDIECRLRAKSGEYKWIRARGQALWSDFGQPTRMAGSITDITAAKETEAALIQGQLEVQKASQAKSDFLATISHEMRTPLNAIVGTADYLTKTPLSPEQLSLVNRCTKASDGLLRIIEDLLLAAKADSGTLEIVQEPFQLPEVISECIMMLSTEAQNKGLSLTLHLEPNLPARVVGDAGRLRQVLLNLIRNAIKFTHSGAIDVRVRPLLGEGHNCKVQFSVSDTGIGIAPEQQAQLFQRFAQADSKSNRQFGGVGLGLSICKQLVELMRGRIWVDSRKDHGSTFSFILPLTIMSDGAGHRPSKDQASTAEPTKTQKLEKSLRILLAEDSVESQEIMQLYLRSTAHRLDIASTGTSAVSLFKERTYDVVFMDLNMPEIDGFTATKIIRSWEAEQKRRPTPIVALTANGLLETQQESFKAGCDWFLTKPIKMDMLLQAIQKYAAEPAQASASQTDTDRAAATEMVQLKLKFLRNRYHDMSVLRTAVAKEHFDQIRTIGHRIKGLAGSYGLHEIGTIGSILEQAAIDRDASAVTAQITKLRDAVMKAEMNTEDDQGLFSHAA